MAEIASLASTPAALPRPQEQANASPPPQQVAQSDQIELDELSPPGPTLLDEVAPQEDTAARSPTVPETGQQVDFTV